MTLLQAYEAGSVATVLGRMGTVLLLPGLWMVGVHYHGILRQQRLAHSTTEASTDFRMDLWCLWKDPRFWTLVLVATALTCLCDWWLFRTTFERFWATTSLAGLFLAYWAMRTTDMYRLDDYRYGSSLEMDGIHGHKSTADASESGIQNNTIVETTNARTTVESASEPKQNAPYRHTVNDHRATTMVGGETTSTTPRSPADFNFAMLPENNSGNRILLWWTMYWAWTALVYLWACSRVSIAWGRLASGHGTNTVGNEGNLLVTDWQVYNDTFRLISIQNPNIISQCPEAAQILSNCTWLEDPWDPRDSEDRDDIRHKSTAWFTASKTFCTDGPQQNQDDNNDDSLPYNALSYVYNVGFNTYTCQAEYETPYLFWDSAVQKRNRFGKLETKLWYFGTLGAVSGILSLVLWMCFRRQDHGNERLEWLLDGNEIPAATGATIPHTATLL